MSSSVEITARNFASTVEKDGIVLLDFWASWCGPCRAFAPVFEAAAQRHADVVFGKVDTEAQPELAAQLHIQAIPTLMAFRDGILVFAQPGMIPGEVLDELIRRIAALDMDAVKRELAKEDSASASLQPGDR